jgi:hypothetical protein
MNLQGKCLKREKEKSSWEMREQAWFEYSQSGKWKVCVCNQEERSGVELYREKKGFDTYTLDSSGCK